LYISDLRQLLKSEKLTLRHPRGETIYQVLYKGEVVYGWGKQGIEQLGPASAEYAIKHIKKNLPHKTVHFCGVCGKTVRIVQPGEITTADLPTCCNQLADSRMELI
jgi:hypothetical protein